MDKQDIYTLSTGSSEQTGFFGKLAQAVIALFGPAKDDYPATGTQPFTGDVDHKTE